MIIALTSSQEDLIAVLNRQPSQYLSTFELRDAGIDYPAQRIAELKAKGALIDKLTKPTRNGHGKLCINIAHYRIGGWS